MKFNLKEYQKQKIKHQLKNNPLILFSINTNQNSQTWITTEQELKKLNFNYYKIYNNSTKKIIKNSINKNTTNLINSTFFLLKPTSKTAQINNKILHQLNSIFFTILAIKLNQKIYMITQSKSIVSLNQKKNMAILYQFLLTNMKLKHYKKQFTF